ncbi:MAG: TRAP transporter substrate-binding protein [Geminicoccaceae bacterium]|nr:TRAP transporter substrate-binding protein [Geminicoccaceae bacterium]
MKLRRRSLVAGGAALAAAPLAAPAVLRAQETRSWRMVTSWPKGLPGPGVTAARLARRIGDLSGGRIRVEVYGAGEIVPAFEVLDAVGAGTAELGHTAAVFWAGKSPIAPFFLAVPMGLTPPEHVAWVEHGGGQALWDELYAPFGAKPFMAGNTGMSMEGWFKREIEGLADFRGLHFRMPGLGGEMYRPFGIVQVSLPPGETLPALETGALDAAEFAGPSSDLALGFYKAAPFYYGPGLHEPNGTGECIVNLRLWESLGGEDRAILANACAAEASFALAESERMNMAALAALVGEHGVKLRRYPEPVEAALRESGRAVIADFGKRDGIEKRVHDSYVAMLDGLRDWTAVSMGDFLQARRGRG